MCLKISNYYWVAHITSIGNIFRRILLSKRYHANLKSKRKSKKQNIHNSAERSRMRTIIKKTVTTIGEGDYAKSKEAFKGMCSVIDKAVKHNLVHQKTASRKKSRILKKIEALKA